MSGARTNTRKDPGAQNYLHSALRNPAVDASQPTTASALDLFCEAPEPEEWGLSPEPVEARAVPIRSERRLGFRALKVTA